MTEACEIWVLTDGRAGNHAQAMAMAEAIARARPATISERPVKLGRWAVLIPPGLSYRIGARRGGWPFSGLAGGTEALHPPWPDLVIGAGRRAAPIVAALRRLHRIKAVQLLDPRMPAGAFDAVVAPSHDGSAGANVLRSTGALSRLTPERVREAAGSWRARFEALPAPRLAVLIGGPSRSSNFGAADARNLVRALEALSSRFGLMVTPSRRTPPELIAALDGLRGERVFLWDGAGDNPYPALLGFANAVLVTGDSVNMASEAASTGLPVHVFPVTGVAGKIARFHESLAATGASRRFTGEIGQWSYVPLAEADRIAGELIRRGVV